MTMIQNYGTIFVVGNVVTPKMEMAQIQSLTCLISTTTKKMQNAAIVRV